MSEEKHADNDPERTLVTLEQLSQTIEVMTSVVNRLRQHLSEQLKATADAALCAEGSTEKTEKEVQTDIVADTAVATEQKKESFVVEIRQQEELPAPKNGENLH